MKKPSFRQRNRKIDAFAFSVADEVYSYVQPEEAEEYFITGMSKDKRKVQRRIDQQLQDTINKMRSFISTNSLGIYGKARLQKKFNDRLIELGYDARVTRKLVEVILLRGLARGPAG